MPTTQQTTAELDTAAISPVVSSVDTPIAHPTCDTLRAPALSQLLRGVSHSQALALFDQCVVSGTRFLTTILVGRFCGADVLGVYSLAFAPLVLIACAQEALLSQPYTVYGNRLQGLRRATLAGSVLAHHFIVALVAMIALAVAATISSLGIGPPQLAPILLILVAVIPFSLLWELGRRFAYAHLNLTTAVVMDLGIATIQIGGILLLASLGLLNASAAYLIIGLACGMVGLTWLFLRRGNFVIRRKDVFRDWKTNWALGRWGAAGQVVGLLHGHSMPWMLALTVGTFATGVFVACESIILLSNPIILGIGNLLGPRTALAYAKGGQAQVRRVTGRTVLLMTGAMALLYAFLLIASEHLIWLFYGDQYDGQGRVLMVLALCPLAWAVSTAVSKGLLAIERADVSFRATFCGLVITLVLAFPLVAHWQTIGAAWALLAGSVASAAWQGAAFMRLTGELRHDTSANETQ